MLKVTKLDPAATLPTVAHPGEDIGYDLYALEDIFVIKGSVVKVRTGIAVAAFKENSLFQNLEPLGLLIKDRSSMASKGVFTHGGVIDAGYRGEILVNLSTINLTPYMIVAGAKFAQMVPVPVLTAEVVEVTLPPGSRGEKGFGSTGV